MKRVDQRFVIRMINNQCMEDLVEIDEVGESNKSYNKLCNIE